MPSAAVNPFAPPLQLGYPPASWTPALEAAGQWWFDAQTAASLTDIGGGPINDGDTVGTWTNRIVLAPPMDLGLVLAIGRPTYRLVGINGFPALEYVAIQCLSSTVTGAMVSMPGLTVFTVCSIGAWPVANAAANYIWANGGMVSFFQLGGTQADMTKRSGGRRLAADAFQGRNVGVVTLGTPFLFTSAMNYRGFFMDQYVNGLYMGTLAPFQVQGDSDANAPQSVQVGAGVRFDGLATDNPLTGFVGETVGIRRYMQQTELVAAHTYFKRRWGIP